MLGENQNIGEIQNFRESKNFREIKNFGESKNFGETNFFCRTVSGRQVNLSVIHYDFTSPKVLCPNFSTP